MLVWDNFADHPQLNYPTQIYRADNMEFTVLKSAKQYKRDSKTQEKCLPPTHSFYVHCDLQTYNNFGDCVEASQQTWNEK